MKKISLFLLMFLTLNCKSGGILEIHDEYDVKRVRNNVAQFWQKHTDLIPYLKEEGSLPPPQLKSIENDKTCVVIDYKKSKNTFKKKLRETISYVKEHFTDIEKLLGSEEAFQFQQGLYALTHLINRLPQGR